MREKIVIIGNGIAGTTVARHVRKNSDSEIIVVGSESPFLFARTALMYVYMGSLTLTDIKLYEDWFWKKNRIQLRYDTASTADFSAKTIRLDGGESLGYDRLVLATGSRPNRLSVPGEDLVGVSAFYSLGDLERIQDLTRGGRQAVVIGGGLIGVELAEMLVSRGIQVTFLVREARYLESVLPAEESELIAGEIRSHGINLVFGETVAAVTSRNGRTVSGVRTESGETYEADFVGVAIGVGPNVEFAARNSIPVSRGIVVNEFFETQVPDVYAVGDCVEFERSGIGHKTIEQLWYAASRHGIALASNLTGVPVPYDRHVFYNSAKFFELEYQTYGSVPADSDERNSVVWSDGHRLIRIVFDPAKNTVLGFSSLGVRMRQAKCVEWIQNGDGVQDVVARIHQALFDPEFTRRLDRQAFRVQQVNPNVRASVS